LPGFDPAIHAEGRLVDIAEWFHSPDFSMDHRVKPGGDEVSGADASGERFVLR